MHLIIVQQSKQNVSFTRSISDVVFKLKKNLKEADMVVRRSNVLSDALRTVKKETFHPEKLINVIL